MDVAVNAVWLGVALVWRGAIGRVVRRTAERVVGQPSRFEHPLLDLLVGLLAGWMGFAVWSALLKRAGGVGAPAAAFAIVELIVVASLALWQVRTGWPAPPARLPSLHASVRVATSAALFAGLVGADILSFRSGNSDQDQHVAWALEVAHAGVVPDHYEGTDAAIDYPLGLHTLAVSTASALVSPAIVVNALPLLTTLLVVALVCGVTADVAAGRAPRGGAEAAASTAGPPLGLVLLEAGCVVALGLALFSGAFSVWPRYVVTGRQVAGLCQLVPILAFLIALLPAIPPAAAPRSHGLRRSALLVAALMASGALTAALNPVLVPLQAVLSGVALTVAVLRRQVTWSGLASGAAIGSVLGVTVLASDPYLGRRASLPGLRPPDAPYLAVVQGDFTRDFTGRSCFTLDCAARAFVSPVTLAVAREPFLAVTRGIVELMRTAPAPLRYDQPAPGRHRFPDLTGVGLAPIHGRVAPYLFALLPLAFVVTAIATRHRRLLAALTAVVVAIAIDAGIRGVLRALVAPDDPGLRLLPYYADVAAAIAFTQVLWPLLLVSTAFIGATGDTTRRRRLRLAAAAAVLVPLGASAAGPVARAMSWSRILDAPSRADVEALDRLERRIVPAGESFLVTSQAPGTGGERWIFPTDDGVLFYVHARRPTLFLYFLDHAARYGSAGLESTCAALQSGARDTLLARHRARWAIGAGSPAQAVAAVGRRTFCGRRLSEWFPALRAAGSDGRLTIVELWADPR